MTDVSKVVIESQAEVIVAKVAPEGTMAEYAARREAELKGETLPEVKDAAAPEVKETAAAADESAAATDEKTEEGKTTEDSATADPEKDIEDSHPKKKGITKRFGELTKEREDAKREAEAAKKEAEEAKAEAARLKEEIAEAKRSAEAAIPIVPKVEDDPAPVPPVRTAFDDPDEFDDAAQKYLQEAAAFTARQEIRKANEAAEAGIKARQEADQARINEENQARIQTQIVELHRTFNERVEKAAIDYPDYAEKVTNNEKLTLRNDVFFAIEQAELAPHILYHLANNPEIAANLNGLPPAQALLRIGELSAEIRAERKPKPSKAAEPIKPVGSRTNPERKTPDEESMAEYAARREKEERDAMIARQKRRSASH